MLIKNAQTKRHTELTLPKILIVEDNDAISDVLKELFQMIGYRCMIRRTAIDAHQLVKDYQPSLVIVDYLLPDMNGGELCGQIKRDPATKDIPVIICSAYPKVLLSLGTYGSDAFIPKPFNLSELTQKIEQLLEARVL
jgi:CheY-like chemotaxis protein